MKKILAVAALLVTAPALAGESKTTVKITGWHCEGCAEETVAALKKVKGVKSAEADFDKNLVVVAYDDSKASPNDFEKAIKKTGYEVAK